MDCKRPCLVRTSRPDDIHELSSSPNGLQDDHMDAIESQPGEWSEDRVPSNFMHAAVTAARNNQVRSKQEGALVGPQWPTVDVEIHVVPRNDFKGSWLQKRNALWHAGLSGGLH